jgi:NAD(P)-dependent dehydrogenase (short-subunit alcohol dehydrogenase family)
MLRDEGFELTIASRRQEKVEAAAAELGGDVLALVANVTDEADCRRIVAEHHDRFGRLDVLVNSAGIGIAGDIDSVETKHLDLQLAVNLRAPILVTREAMPLLRDSHGWIVNLASIAGTIATSPLTVYGATKAALIQFTRTLNEAGERDGVRACALCPAYVDTPMAAHSGLGSDEMIRPEDCAAVVQMLLRLGPRARVPAVVIERLGEGSF